MTLGELKELVDDMVDQADSEEMQKKKVYAEYDYGDHCHTRALVHLCNLELIVPTKTAYSDSGLQIPSERDTEDESTTDQDDTEATEDSVFVLTSSR